MYPHREIYRKGRTRLPADVSMHASGKVRLVYNLAVISGIFLIGLTVIRMGATYLPLVSSEIRYAIRASSDTTDAIEARQKEEELIKAQIQANIEGAKQTEVVQEEAASYGLNSHFSVFIPKIDAKANVVANVDTADEASYREALSQGIAHAAGTNFPGGGEGIFLFSHSTDFSYNVARYNAVFYLLRKLERDDEVVVFFTDQKHTYKVTDKLVVEADDISWLTKDYGSETLILQTCDPPGTAWKRLLVIAEPV